MKINNIIYLFSFSIISIILVGKIFLNSFFNNNFIALFLFTFVLILLFLTLVKKKISFKKNQKFFCLICIFMILPSLFNNAYLLDGVNVISYLFYILICLMGIILVLLNFEKKYLDVFFKFVAAFAICSALVTWASYFIPDFYITYIVPLLPDDVQFEVIRMFTYNNAFAGLTDHYSRNAFYIILGIFSLIYFLKDVSHIIKFPKSILILICFLFVSLFLIGKRGHLLFFIFSFIVAYFILNKINIITFLKFILIFIFFLLFVYWGYYNLPGIENVINRFFDSGVSGDISTGRFDLYINAFDLYKQNSYSPIGWGQFAKSTNYYFAAVHNDYIQLFIETGFVGFLMIIGSNFIILLKSIKVSKTKRSSLTLIILIYNLFFMLYSLTGLPHYDIETMLFYVFINSLLFNDNLEIGC